MPPTLPPPSAIPISVFKHALSLYPALVESVYKAKLKDPKKVSDALKRDAWRFEELPSALDTLKASNASQGLAAASDTMTDLKEGGLTKDAVERLVQWKITHGHSRPFLPAMVRKNDGLVVQTQTSLAFEKLSSSSSSPPTKSTLVAALDLVCKLTGIGPATGTLILTIYDPVHIPFFQDEMFMWFFPSSSGDKLKYSQKEYLQLLEAVSPALKKLDVPAVELEKVSFVLGHMEKLDESARQGLEDALKGALPTGNNSGSEDSKPSNTGVPSVPSEDTANIPKGRKRMAKAEPDESTGTQPKRRSQRNR